MVRKKSKNRRNNKYGHSRSGRQARAGRVDWPVVICIVCMAIVGLLWVLSNWQVGEKSPAEKPSSISAELAVSGLSPELRAVKVLEKGESELVEQLQRDFPTSEFTTKIVTYVYGRRGNSAGTMAYGEKLLEQNPNQPDVYHEMARQACARAEFDKAVGFWRKILELDPTTLRVRNEIGAALIASGKFSEAIKDLEEEVRLSPGSSHILYSHYLLGQAYLQLLQYEKAKENYEKAIPLNTDATVVARANYGLSRVYTKLKQRDKAKEHMALYKSILEEIRPSSQRGVDLTIIDDAGIFYISQYLSNMYIDADKFYRARGQAGKAEYLLKSAEQIFQQVILQVPEWSTGYRDLASLYLRTNRKLSMAKELAEKAVALDPAGHNYFVLSRVCYANGDPANAMRAVERAIELQPGNSEYKQWHDFLKKGN